MRSIRYSTSGNPAKMAEWTACMPLAIAFSSDGITEAHVLGQVGLDRIRIVVGGQL